MAACPVHQQAAGIAEREAIAHATEAARLARREVLVDTRTNAAGHAVLAAAAHLLESLERFQVEAASAEVYQQLRRAGLAPDGPSVGNEEFGSDHFDNAAEDALGFAWSVRVFADLFRSGLARHPDAPRPCRCHPG